MDKLLICGVETLVGGNFALSLGHHYELVGLSSDQSFKIPGCRTIACDLTNHEDLTYRVLDESPRAVIYCGPLSQSAWDLAGVDVDGQQEAAIARTLVAGCERSGSQLVVISTDAVFCGPRLFHTEISPTIAAGNAAEAARVFEQALAGSRALVLRTHVYGWGSDVTATTFAQRVWEQLIAGQACEVDAQAYATPILASDLAELVDRAIQAELCGLFHLTGAERTSQYRFAAELAVTFGLTGRQVLLTAPSQTPPPRPFVNETSLNTRAIRRALEQPLPMLREGLNRFAEQIASGYWARLQSSPRAVVARQPAA